MRIPPSPAIQRISRVFKPKEKELGKMYRVRTGLARGRSPAVLPAAEGVWQSSLQPSPPSLELGAIGNLERPSDLLGLVVVDPDVDSGKELQFSTIAAQPHTSRRSRSQLSSDETLGSFCKNFLSLQAGLWSSTGWKPAEAPESAMENNGEGFHLQSRRLISRRRPLCIPSHWRPPTQTSKPRDSHPCWTQLELLSLSLPLASAQSTHMPPLCSQPFCGSHSTTWVPKNLRTRRASSDSLQDLRLCSSTSEAGSGGFT
ncbi:uncharacterized protein LOC117717906 isoform X2 [Arvicanthis niloticus]|uniref:uncharacterized protein LOC117717906 isoform X2 n=1 Tax=Arvicanthis niloticus TaxID=61156 RepID=UPI00402BA67C